MADMTAQDDLSRRSVLRKAALGVGAAGAVWVAPSVLTLDAAMAQGTCATGLFDWAAQRNNCDLVALGSQLGTSAVGGVTVYRLAGGVQQSSATTTPSSTAWTNNAGDNFYIRDANGGTCDNGCTTDDFPRGNSSSFYSLAMRETSTGCGGAGTINRWVQTTFEFRDSGGTNPLSVEELTFTLLDIDSGSGNYWDRMEIYINGQSTLAHAGSSATLATTGAGQDIQVLSQGSCVTQPTAGSAGFEAVNNNCSAGTSDTTANLQLRCLTDVTRITIRFRDIRNPAPQTIQWIGISNMTWCT